MSDILAIYKHLAGDAIRDALTVSDITPDVYNLAQLPDAVEDVMLPCRLLLPMQPRGEGRDWSFLALGNTAKLTWRITDLMLWRRAESGIGLEDIAETLIRYAAAYAEMLRAHRSMGQTQAHVTGARIVYGTFNYPDSDQGIAYDGCAVELDIEEVLSG